MRGLSITKKIALDLTADQWELFTHEPTLKARANTAARALNAAIVEAVNAGKSRREVEKAVGLVQQEFRDVGASDSEPFYTLRDVLDEVLGLEV